MIHIGFHKVTFSAWPTRFWWNPGVFTILGDVSVKLPGASFAFDISTMTFWQRCILALMRVCVCLFVSVCVCVCVCVCVYPGLGGESVSCPTGKSVFVSGGGKAGGRGEAARDPGLARPNRSKHVFLLLLLAAPRWLAGWVVVVPRWPQWIMEEKSRASIDWWRWLAGCAGRDSFALAPIYSKTFRFARLMIVSSMVSLRISLSLAWYFFS